MTSTSEAKRVLGLAEVTFIAVGFTIGAGVFVFTGIVAKIAGAALPLAYGLAAVPVFVSMLPLAMLGATLPTTGGNYRYPSRMVSPGVAFVGIWVYVLASFVGQIPLYATSCAAYVRLLAPQIDQRALAALVLTVFYLTNLLGVRLAAWIQGLMVVILLLALLHYAGNSLACFDASHFYGFFDAGGGGLALGTALLTFTYFGSNGVIELGGDIRQPDRVIPRALLIAFPLITVVYLLVSTATVGVLPAEALAAAKEPLIAAAEACTAGGGTARVVVVGGAVLALTTTLNALFIVGTKSLMMIVEDRILPAVLGRTSQRFGSAYVLLTALWLLSVLGVLTGFSLETFASYAALGGTVVFFPVLVASLRLPGQYPEAYARSRFKLRRWWLWLCPAVGFAVGLFFCAVILIELRSAVKVLLFFLFVLSGVAVYQLRKRQLRRRGVDLGAIRGRRLDEV